MRRSPLRNVSKAQHAKNVELRKARRKRAEMADYVCEARIEDVCTGYGQHAHHIVRRSQGGTNDVESLRWLCRARHSWVHNNIAKATTLGLLASASATGRTEPTSLGDGAFRSAKSLSDQRPVAVPSPPGAVPDERHPGAIAKGDAA